MPSQGGLLRFDASPRCEMLGADCIAGIVSHRRDGSDDKRTLRGGVSRHCWLIDPLATVQYPSGSSPTMTLPP